MLAHRAVGRLRFIEAQPAVSTRLRGALVCLHAFPLNARMWEAQLAFADPGWRVIAPQFRGFDGENADPAAESVDDYAGDVIDLLDALHIQDAVVAGLSLGGYVAFAMQRLAPRYIRGLVLADTRPQADTPDGVEGRKRMIQLASDGGAAAVAAEMIPKLLGETTRRDRPAVVDTVRTLALSSSVAAITGALRAMMTRPDSTPLLSSIHVPTLIVVGDEDVVTPPAVAEEMHRALAGSELAIVPGSGHLSNLENTPAFTAALARFLQHRI
jgi:3-oxoadipate enol-lactonase